MGGQNLTKFCKHIIIDKIYVDIVKRHLFRKFATELRPLIDVKSLVFAQYLDNEWTEFNHIYIIIDKIYVVIVKRHLSQIFNRVPALD